MSLINCTECGHTVSTKASVCPNCGYAVKDILNDLKGDSNCSDNSIEEAQNGQSEEFNENAFVVKINNKNIDVSEVKNILQQLPEDDLKHYRYIYSENAVSSEGHDRCKKRYCDQLYLNDLYDSAIKLLESCEQKYDLIDRSMAEFLKQFIDNGFSYIEFEGYSLSEYKRHLKEICQRTVRNRPKCPTCGSTNIRKIGTGERVASVVGLGLLSKKINKTWSCNNCGHTW